MTGFNTDGIGAVTALEEAGTSLEGKMILLIGAGGAGRAVAYELVKRECRLTLMNRTRAKAQRLAKQLHREFGASVANAQLSKRNLHTLIGEAEVIINASSMGMNGKADLSIKPTWLKPEHYVFELVYRPLQTRMLQYAALAGAKTITGLDMLVNQGACAFTLWTGKEAPLDQMRKAIAGG